jgi:exonuclease VII large subunit
MPTNPQSSADMQVLFDWIKRLEDKFDTLSTKLEEKNDSNYKRLEEKMDSNYDTLEKKITEYIDSNSKNLDSVKDKLQDHEYRIRGVEATSKSTNDKIVEFLTITASERDPKNNTFFKKFTKTDNIVVIIVLILVFVSGKFEMISQIITSFFKK